jgi:hypothetical protein
MTTHLIRRIAQGACALAASTCVLLAIAAAAQARPTDTWPQRMARDSAAPNLAAPGPADGGPDTIDFVLIATGAAAALLGAGYLGAHVAIRTSRAQA